uniref:Putative scaffold/matrix specific factor hnrnp-u/saf-a n=1 Tax=Triatoma dimidiata TaxID=72491 RepID=A0A0V0G3Z0_TRIDM
MNPSKLKVVELRAELSARGLDTKGIKSVLVERLQEALDKESGGAGHKEDDAQDNRDTDVENESVLNSTNATEQHSTDNRNQDEDAPTESQDMQENDVDKIAGEVDDDQSNTGKSAQVENENGENDQPSESVEAQPTEEMQQDQSEEDRHWENSQEEFYQDQRMSEKMEEENTESDANPGEQGSEKEDKQIKQEPLTDSGYHESSMEVVPKDGKEKEKEGYESHVKNEPFDGNDVKHIKTENEIKTERDSYREDRKRKRSLSPSPYKSRQLSPARQVKEEEPDIKDTDVTLSWYDSDLNLMIDKDTLFTATPMSQGGFGFIWAGVRGTYGYTEGKLCFQVKLVENCNVSHLENEPNPNVLRVGWSTFDTSMQLGEEPLSFGYGGTGKISVDCQFTNYGKPFGEGDVVTAYLEFTETDFIISYSVNDEYLNVAWQLPKDELQGKALAPHVLTKNVKFAVNFGQTDPWGEIQQDFTFVKSFPVENAVAGPKRPEKRSDCEMIMMCGLPACGKTTWANNYAKEHPEKRYNIIGTNALIDKMKVMGLPRKANYSGRWDILIDKCTKCLNKLMDIGAHRRRHFILDQTNVYPAAQRRKMRNFEGFIRKAVVIVPTDEEFKTRTQKQAQQEKKDVPENAVMEMKANFVLPDKSLFSEIIYSELDENEAKSLVHKYNKEAAAAGFARKGPMGGGGGGGGGGSGSGGGRGSNGPNVKRFRGDFGHGGGHQQHHGGGGGGGQRHDGFRRGPPPSSPFRNFYRA